MGGLVRVSVTTPQSGSKGIEVWQRRMHFPQTVLFRVKPARAQLCTKIFQLYIGWFGHGP